MHSEQTVLQLGAFHPISFRALSAALPEHTRIQQTLVFSVSLCQGDGSVPRNECGLPVESSCCVFKKKNVSLSSIFPTNRRAELKKRWFQRWEHKLIPGTEEIISSSSSWMWKSSIVVQEGWLASVMQLFRSLNTSCHRNQPSVVYSLSHFIKYWSSALIKLWKTLGLHLSVSMYLC